ncbi:hypothetical protein RND81_01G070900 [Saponaria officinalis]|uniref:Uncharacterized protein n=1 Tax=Saponaria officinalis TaxID=3572 RepID=A0AAW1NGW4_SAPOF
MKTCIANFVVISMIICFVMLNIADAQNIAPSDAPAASDAPAPAGFDCDTKCAYRCSKSKLQSRCIHFCEMCCAKCKCVPSGTSGNKDECPCYRDWYSKQGKPKCP